MKFSETYLGRLRARVGHDLVLMPGVAVVAFDRAGRVVLGRRRDMNIWSLPTGGAETGSSFGRTAVAEAAEEIGIEVSEADLVAYACYSDRHIVRYPSGDVTHWFTLCFVAERWRGVPRADGIETTAVDAFALDRIPQQVQPSTVAMLDLYRRYASTGAFQIA